MELKLKIDPDRLSLNDLILFLTIQESGSIAGTVQNVTQMRNLLARLTVDESDSYVEPEQAQSFVGEMPLGDLIKAVNAVGQRVKALQDEAVPPATGNAS